jgi:hypothetical protein
LADALTEQGDPLGEELRGALDDPELTPIGIERYSAVSSGRYAVAVFRFEPFAIAAGLPRGQRSVDTEFVLMPPHGATRAVIDIDPDGEGPPEHLVRSQLGAGYLIARSVVSRRIAGQAGITEERALAAATFEDAEHWALSFNLALPNRQQWIYAARGGSQQRFCTGASLSQAWANANSRPAWQAPANAFGLIGIHRSGQIEQGSGWSVFGTGDGSFEETNDDYPVSFTTSPQLALRPIRSIPSTIAVLQAVLLADEPRRDDLLQSIAACGPSMLPVLRELASSGLPRLSRWAVQQARHHGQRATELLFELAASSQPIARLEALSVLAERNEPLDPLLPLLRAADPALREDLARALIHRTQPTAAEIDAMRVLLGTTTTRQHELRLALRRAGAQPAPLHYADAVDHAVRPRSYRSILSTSGSDNQPPSWLQQVRDQPSRIERILRRCSSLIGTACAIAILLLVVVLLPLLLLAGLIFDRAASRQRPTS